MSSVLDTDSGASHLELPPGSTQENRPPLNSQTLIGPDPESSGMSNRTGLGLAT
jgi:hypothetical protein